MVEPTHPARPDRDERGTTAVEYLMVVALLVAAVVLVTTLGASLAGDVA